MRSKLLAMTALTPSRKVPLAAQSRDEPVPYCWPASTTSDVPDGLVAHRRVVDRLTAPVGKCLVTPPSVPGAIWLRIRTLAKVPRTITSWLPRREP
jgi:hypothetical protein